jgi:SRSO17 transposase
VSWTEDVGRCAAAGVPAGTTVATKITLGRRMLDRALDAGVPAGWATADDFYGGDRSLRRDLQGRRLGYVLAVAKSHRVDVGGLRGVARGDHIATTLTTKAWNRYGAGDGFHWLLIRRRICCVFTPSRAVRILSRLSKSAEAARACGRA